MNMDDWKFPLLIAVVDLCFAVITGDLVALVIFCGFYYLALKTFNGEKYDEQQ